MAGKSSVLFLDFDGVLHPVGDRAEAQNVPPFVHLPRLEDWLRRNEQVRVVISSSWRSEMDLDDLREIFSVDLKDRVIGVCPELPVWPVPKFWRHQEILTWIHENGYDGPWFALDDAWEEFPADCAELVMCVREIGLDENVIVMLDQRVGG